MNFRVIWLFFKKHSKFTVTLSCFLQCMNGWMISFIQWPDYTATLADRIHSKLVTDASQQPNSTSPFFWSCNPFLFLFICFVSEQHAVQPFVAPCIKLLHHQINVYIYITWNMHLLTHLNNYTLYHIIYAIMLRMHAIQWLVYFSAAMYHFRAPLYSNQGLKALVRWAFQRHWLLHIEVQ